MTRGQNMKMIAAFAATFALFATLILAQQKQTPPAGGPPKPFTVPAHETYALANGMKVTLVPYGNLPKVTLSLVVRTGNLNEPADMPERRHNHEKFETDCGRVCANGWRGQCHRWCRRNRSRH